METKRKARKVYVCCECERKISKGDFYMDYHIKSPRYANGDECQVGIEYINARLCRKCTVLWD